MTCIFCDQLAPEQILYETDYFKVVLDIHPIQPGHLLVISKNHRMSLQELSTEELVDMAQLTQQLTALVEKVLNLDGVSIVTNNHHVMDEGVHFHSHIIPRRTTDGFWNNLAPQPLDIDVEKLLQALKKKP